MSVARISRISELLAWQVADRLIATIVRVTGGIADSGGLRSAGAEEAETGAKLERPAPSDWRHDGVAVSVMGIAALTAAAALIVSADDRLVGALIAGLTGLGLLFLKIESLKRVLLGLMIIEIPLQVDVYIGHDPVIAQSGALSGLNISITTFSLIVLYTLWVAEAAAGRRPSGSPRAYLAVPTLVYLTLVLASTSVAADKFLAYAEVVILVQAVLVFVYLLFHVNGRTDVIFVVVMVIVGLLLQSLIALSVVVLGGGVSIGPIKAGLAGRRLFGTFGSPVVHGGYLALTLPIALGLILTQTKRMYRALGVAAFAFGSIALVLTFTRGAWGGFALTISFMVVYALRRGWASTALPALLGVIGLVAIGLFRDEIVSRATQFGNESALARFPLMDLAMRMVGDNPFLGVGVNHFANSMNQYLTVEFSRDWIFTVHNKYLLVWSETGIAALVAFLWVLIAAVRSGWAAVAARETDLSPIALGLAAGIVANMIHMLVDIFHARPQLQMLWLSIGVLLAIFHQTHSRRADLEQAYLHEEISTVKPQRPWR